MIGPGNDGEEGRVTVEVHVVGVEDAERGLVLGVEGAAPGIRQLEENLALLRAQPVDLLVQPLFLVCLLYTSPSPRD